MVVNGVTRIVAEGTKHGNIRVGVSTDFRRGQFVMNKFDNVSVIDGVLFDRELEAGEVDGFQSGFAPQVTFLNVIQKQQKTGGFSNFVNVVARDGLSVDNEVGTRGGKV